MVDSHGPEAKFCPCGALSTFRIDDRLARAPVNVQQGGSSIQLEANSMGDQFGAPGRAQGFHCAVFVEGHGARADAELLAYPRHLSPRATRRTTSRLRRLSGLCSSRGLAARACQSPLAMRLDKTRLPSPMRRIASMKSCSVLFLSK